MTDSKISKKIIYSIRTDCKFDTTCLTDEENIKRMNKRMEKNIIQSERKITEGKRKIKNIGRIGNNF